MIKVRATKNGTYAGYYWNGPIDTDQGTTPGEVFEIDDKPFVLKDEFGKPVQETELTGQVDDRGNPVLRKAWVMENGKMKKDAQGNPVPKLKMTTFFSPEWMVRVPDDTELTYEDRVIPFPTLEVYRVKKQKEGKIIALPSEVAQAAGLESPI